MNAERLAKTVSRVPRGLKVLRAPQALLVRTAPQAPMADKDRRVRPGHKAPRQPRPGVFGTLRGWRCTQPR